MNCSSERIADLLDGRLSAAAAEDVLAHAAACDDCHAELRSMRALRGRLADADVPRADDLLTQRLSMLPITAPLPAVGGPLPGPLPGSRVVRSGAALAGGAVLVVVALAWVGARPAGAPTVVPAVDRYLAEHVACTDTLPLEAPGGVRTAIPVGLSRPAP